MPAKLSPARAVAYDAFVAVMAGEESPEEAIERLIKARPAPLSKPDRGLVKELVFGSLRWYSKIYWILQKTSKRNLDDATPEIRAALVLGAYQIFYMDRVPDRAAVNESVEYVRYKEQAHAVKFINGILRTIARRSEYFAKPDKDRAPVDYLALQFAHPRWLVERWVHRFSFDRMKELLAANNRVPPYTVRINALRVSQEELPELRNELLRRDRAQSERRSLRSCLTLRSAPAFGEGSLFSEGVFTIQDEASQLIANLVAPEEGDFVVDACAGPGGKISHIYELAGGKAKVVGLEKEPRQLERGMETCTRLGHTDISWIEGDFADFQPEAAPDRILLDAPCSGLGVLRRHPEGKWHKKPTIIPRMAKEQRRLLTHALEILKPGGELVYSVCSFEPEESAEHLRWLRESFGDKIEVVAPQGRLPDYYRRFVTRDRLLLIYSGNKDLMDGFGAFIIRKVADASGSAAPVADAE